jgi:S1-C subfamily serine protease
MKRTSFLVFWFLAAVAIFSNGMSFASTAATSNAALAVKLCESLEHAEPSERSLASIISERVVGAIFTKPESNKWEKLPELVASGIRISETALLTVNHAIPFAHSLQGRLVLFGCVKPGAGIEDISLFELQFLGSVSSSKEHLDFTVIPIKVLHQGKNSASNSDLALRVSGCKLDKGTPVVVSGFSTVSDGARKQYRLRSVSGSERLILHTERFEKTAGNLMLIDYPASEIHDGFSGGTVMNMDGCLIGMHHRRFSKIQEETNTRWEPYVSKNYWHCRRKIAEDENELTARSAWNDNCLPAQSYDLRDIAKDAVRRNQAFIKANARLLFDLAVDSE